MGLTTLKNLGLILLSIKSISCLHSLDESMSTDSSIPVKEEQFDSVQNTESESLLSKDTIVDFDIETLLKTVDKKVKSDIKNFTAGTDHEYTTIQEAKENKDINSFLSGENKQKLLLQEDKSSFSKKGKLEVVKVKFSPHAPKYICDPIKSICCKCALDDDYSNTDDSCSNIAVIANNSSLVKINDTTEKSVYTRVVPVAVLDKDKDVSVKELQFTVAKSEKNVEKLLSISVNDPAEFMFKKVSISHSNNLLSMNKLVKWMDNLSYTDTPTDSIFETTQNSSGPSNLLRKYQEKIPFTNSLIDYLPSDNKRIIDLSNLADVIKFTTLLYLAKLYKNYTIIALGTLLAVIVICIGIKKYLIRQAQKEFPYIDLYDPPFNEDSFFENEIDKYYSNSNNPKVYNIDSVNCNYCYDSYDDKNFENPDYSQSCGINGTSDDLISWNGYSPIVKDNESDLITSDPDAIVKDYKVVKFKDAPTDYKMIKLNKPGYSSTEITVVNPTPICNNCYSSLSNNQAHSIKNFSLYRMPRFTLHDFKTRKLRVYELE